MIPNLHLLGIQGSGKGTQSALLVEHYRASYIGSGNLFRQRAAIPDALGHEISTLLKAGHLLPDQLLVQVVEEELALHPPTDALICDGVIRTLVQRQLLADRWEIHGIERPYLIYLELSEEIAQQRVAKRLAERDLAERHDYHAVFSGKLVQREDDNPKSLRERFRLFYELTQPIVAQFQQENRCLTISADQSIEAIHNSIVQFLTEEYPQLVYESH